MKKEAIKKQNSEEWVNIYNDALMVELGFRSPNVLPRDPSVWTKTLNEKRLLKMLRRSCKTDMHFNIIPIKFIPVKAKLIIYLKKNKKFSKSTYSKECWQHEIPFILSNYNDKSIIVKYSYNGKTYAPTEIPFW